MLMDVDINTFKGDELERLYRDARCGWFYPASAMTVHEVVGNWRPASLASPARAGAKRAHDEIWATRA
jgi:hypothetical protein